MPGKPRRCACGRYSRNGFWCHACELWWTYWVFLQPVEPRTPFHAQALRVASNEQEKQNMEDYDHDRLR